MSPLGVHLWEHEGEGDQKWTELIYQAQIVPDQTVKMDDLIAFHNKGVDLWTRGEHWT